MPLTDDRLISIAVIKAKQGMRDELRASLMELIEPTRAEPGNLEYVLYELREEPDTFYMHEVFVDKAGLDVHRETPHFQAFAARAETLLAEPLHLILLDPIQS